MAEDEETRMKVIADLRNRFEMHCETLNGLIFETRECWLGKSSGKTVNKKWKSKQAELLEPEFGFKVHHWNEIRYINKSIEANLAEDIGFARELRDGLRQKFEANEFGADFAASWGLFCYLIGGFDTLLNAKPENRATARTQASGHVQEDKKAQKLWFSLLYLELKKDPKLKPRVVVEEAIVEIINHCIKVDLGKDEGFGKDWFRLLMGDPKKKLDHHLASAFGDKKLSIKLIKETAKNRSHDIPPFEGLKHRKVS